MEAESRYRSTENIWKSCDNRLNEGSEKRRMQMIILLQAVMMSPSMQRLPALKKTLLIDAAVLLIVMLKASVPTMVRIP